MPERAQRNRTLTCTEDERKCLAGGLVRLTSAVTSDEIAGRLVLGDAFETVRFLPADFADLLILAPPTTLSAISAGAYSAGNPSPITLIGLGG